MGSVFRREKQWVVMWKDLAGNWREKRTKCVTKAEAQRLLNEVEVSTERQRLGLEATPSQRAYQPFGEMLDWWWATEGHLQASAHNVKPFIEKHIRPALGRLAAIEVTDARIKEMMNARLRPRSRSNAEKKAKKTGLSAASVNHLRSIVHRIFAFAIEKREWIAENPAGRVAKEKVVKRHPTHLSFEEFELLLVELDPKWRPLFATAVYTGMRQGELLGLRKSDIRFDTGIIKLDHTNTSSTTKDEKDAWIPMAEALRPFLQHAHDTSPSTLLFPREDGTPHSPDVALDKVLRRALGRAGVVTGYTLKCRKKRCGYSVESPTAASPVCPKCAGMKLWSIPHPKHVRFHDLRHTTATLLPKNEVPMQHAQKILRHSDPSLTVDTYGHLDLGDLRRAINRIPTVDGSLFPAKESVLTAPVRRTDPPGKTKPPESKDFSNNSGGFHQSGRQDLNLRPLGPEPSALPG